MTNRERIQVLKEIRDRHLTLAVNMAGSGYKVDLLKKEIEALNWAIKACDKYESKREPKKEQPLCLSKLFDTEF